MDLIVEKFLPVVFLPKIPNLNYRKVFMNNAKLLYESAY